jgi:hypothetical protein
LPIALPACIPGILNRTTLPNLLQTFLLSQRRMAPLLTNSPLRSEKPAPPAAECSLTLLYIDTGL